MEKIKKIFANQTLQRYLMLTYEFLSNYIPYIVAIGSIAIIAGFIYLTVTPTPPYVNSGGSISIIYPSLSDETILEAIAVFLILVLIFIASYVLYSYSTKKYFSTPPSTIIAISLFALFVLFLVLYTMILPKTGG
jgi:hypothetical protein